MHHSILTQIARSFAEKGIDVLRFPFPYMQNLKSGERPTPDGDDVLAQRFVDVIDSFPNKKNVFIGGYSLGARIAASICRRAKAPIRGLLAFSYPFHAKGVPSQKTGLATLLDAASPTLVIQGERDAFGNAPQIEGYSLPDDVNVHYLADANHALIPREKSGHSAEILLEEALLVAAHFIFDHSADGASPNISLG
ncbi:MAG: alpha/beta hydrolase [Deltaproteobacteria bacterium]|nr:alpha/beta hydrolase [Deltaproteobacteria bacterium]